LAFQETFKELMTKKEEATAEREERQHRDKEATTKSFIDLQERSVAADEAICKGKLPLSVFLVINDNPYGLIFSLSFL
jgi:hypothetical protein